MLFPLTMQPDMLRIFRSSHLDLTGRIQSPALLILMTCSPRSWPCFNTRYSHSWHTFIPGPKCIWTSLPWFPYLNYISLLGKRCLDIDSHYWIRILIPGLGSNTNVFVFVNTVFIFEYFFEKMKAFEFRYFRRYLYLNTFVRFQKYLYLHQSIWFLHKHFFKYLV